MQRHSKLGKLKIGSSPENTCLCGCFGPQKASGCGHRVSSADAVTPCETSSEGGCLGAWGPPGQCSSSRPKREWSFGRTGGTEVLGWCWSCHTCGQSTRPLRSVPMCADFTLCSLEEKGVNAMLLTQDDPLQVILTLIR